MPFQTVLNNRTPFASESFVLPDHEGQEVLLIVVVAAFEAGVNGALQLAQEQTPVRVDDEPYGEPGLSSVRYEGDLALEKPSVDVLINGQAYAPWGKPAPTVPVEVHVGDIHKELLVHGDRSWRSALLGGAPSGAEPFETMPIVYERAFGGIDVDPANPEQGKAEPRNRVGVGFRGVLSQNPDVSTEVPNVEYASDRIRARGDRRKPAGLGVVARNWVPRLGFAGTYDDAWLDQRWPLLPEDFDARHYQAAPDDQQSNTLQGGEEVRLHNLTPDGLWQFRLPVLDVPVHLLYDDRQSRASLRMDTVLIEPDLRRLTLTSRLCVSLPRNRGWLREVVLGHISRGWLRARAVRKEYHDRIGTDGTNPTRRSFHL
ncbi:MAG: DUF2169 family type VI secretion system accessory protein [Planctomycetota bacterium]|jgi:hypothetical protein